MNPEKIALLIDSCTDVPPELAAAEGVYSIPVLIRYADGEYRDGIDITAQKVYERFEEEVPKTSLPSLENVQRIFAKIAADGYEKVIAVTISSGLSGTNGVVQLASAQFDWIQTRVIDTKNIGIGAGFTAIHALRMVQQGMGFEEIVRKLEWDVTNTKVFFCVETLEYLRKGGRIGLIPSVLGTVLQLKPIISCNEEGVYYTAAKARGRKRSLEQAIALAQAFAGQGEYNLAIAHGGAEAEASQIAEQAKKFFPGAREVFQGQISPALVVHTGPGLLGIGIQRISR